MSCLAIADGQDAPGKAASTNWKIRAAGMGDSFGPSADVPFAPPMWWRSQPGPGQPHDVIVIESGPLQASPWVGCKACCLTVPQHLQVTNLSHPPGFQSPKLCSCSGQGYVRPVTSSSSARRVDTPVHVNFNGYSSCF